MLRIGETTIPVSHVAGALLALAISTFLIFQNLGTPAIRQWDEAIYADNALDMYSYGDPIVLRRNGEVTLYNTKPPLVIWLQTLSMHVFGVNEFAIRFPSALAGVLTCLLLLIFSAVTLKDLRIGIVSVLVLGTTYGFVRQHVVKTGDLDAVLVFWTTVYVLLFIHLLVSNSDRRTRCILWVGIGVACAYLTKGIAGAIPLAGLGVLTLISQKLKWIFSQRETYYTAIGVLVLIGGYTALREYLAPGYFARVLHVEYGRFTTNYLGWHHHPWYYYFRNWYDLRFFTPYVMWLPVAVIIGVVSQQFRRPVIYLSLQALVFIAILSYPKVKMMWYDAPVYPLLSMICAIGVVAMWKYADRKFKLNNRVSTALLAMLLVCIFFLTVKTMYQRNAELYLPVDILEHEGFFLRELRKTAPDLKKYKVLMLAQQNAHYTQLDFYINAYNRYSGCDIRLLRDTSDVQAGDTIAVCQQENIDWLRKHFALSELRSSWIGCELFRIGPPVE